MDIINIDFVRHAESCANLLDLKLTDEYDEKTNYYDKLKNLVNDINSQERKYKKDFKKYETLYNDICKKSKILKQTQITKKIDFFRDQLFKQNYVKYGKKIKDLPPHHALILLTTPKKGDDILQENIDILVDICLLLCLVEIFTSEIKKEEIKTHVKKLSIYDDIQKKKDFFTTLTSPDFYNQITSSS